MGNILRNKSIASLEIIRRALKDESSNSREELDDVIFNSIEDTKFSHSDTDFERVAHVFHTEWLGIRSACGSIPGLKCAIPADRPLSREDLDRIGSELIRRGADRIVLHGFSPNMDKLVRQFSQSFVGLQLFVVLHGSSPQWVLEYDRDAVQRVLGLAREGLIRRFQIMKAGQETLLYNQYRPILFNLGPRLSGTYTTIDGARAREAKLAIAPGWQAVHKNTATNVAGGLLANRIAEVWTFRGSFDFRNISEKPVRNLTHRSRAEVIEVLARASICLNVSLLDCHPMTNLEAQAVGTPCLRGPLFLDYGDDHQYVRLTEVMNVCSMRAIAEVADRCLAVPWSEMQSMIEEYTAIMKRKSLERYREFLSV
ncbi:hypothetical protein [Prosthecomicrobium hirschii]|uniref:hypothetical protein n=1 Tax=Prosthecodimorpha hirschii TaxID=665126 RepID=UPI0022209FF5|nr:hypothetical protein [Prosthecomicrobium hirschii]MCW1842239.1 hypothetical protein [Prosthecomicrobium hirschii]